MQLHIDTSIEELAILTLNRDTNYDNFNDLLIEKVFSPLYELQAEAVETNDIIEEFLDKLEKRNICKTT